MSKTEVYSWRLESHLKEALERAARAEQRSIASLLHEIVSEWLRDAGSSEDDETAQTRLREEASLYLGSIQGGDPERATRASGRVKSILRQKHASRRSD